MARLTSILRFNGTLEGLSAYRTEGVEDPVVRKKGGPTRRQVLQDPGFANTRKNNTETAGCSRATGLVLQTLGAAARAPLPAAGAAGRG